MNKKYSPLEHPLIDEVQVIDVDGKHIETINSWMFAGMIIEILLDPLAPIFNQQRLLNATAMMQACIKQANSSINAENLLAKCKENNIAASRQLHSLIASGIESLTEEQFDNQN